MVYQMMSGEQYRQLKWRNLPQNHIRETIKIEETEIGQDRILRIPKLMTHLEYNLYH